MVMLTERSNMELCDRGTEKKEGKEGLMLDKTFGCQVKFVTPKRTLN